MIKEKRDKTKVFAFIILGLVMISFLIFASNLALVLAEDSPQTTTTSTNLPGNEIQKEISDFFNQKTVRYIIGIVFGLWEPDNVINEFVGGSDLVRNNVGAIIAYLALWIAILFAFANIMGIFLPTSEWVNWTIGIAITIAAAQLKVVFWIVSVFAVGTVWAGTFSVFFGIFMSFVAFFLLSIGTEVIRKWAVKRKLAIESIKAMKGRSRMSEGIKTLKQAGEEVEFGNNV